MQLQRTGCPDTEDNDHGCRRRIGNDRNQEDTAGTASLKRCEPTVICSFRKSALLVELPRGNAADRDRAVFTVTPTRTASRQMMNGFVEINTFIHSAPKQKSDEWMHLSPIYTRMHGEWLRLQNPLANIHWRFLLISEVIGAPKSSQVTFIYIALLTIQIMSKQLHNIKMGK